VLHDEDDVELMDDSEKAEDAEENPNGTTIVGDSEE
jgi:DNA gyrase subunit A